jgi:hypothetical protein
VKIGANGRGRGSDLLPAGVECVDFGGVDTVLDVLDDETAQLLSRCRFISRSRTSWEQTGLPESLSHY